MENKLRWEDILKDTKDSCFCTELKIKPGEFICPVCQFRQTRGGFLSALRQAEKEGKITMNLPDVDELLKMVETHLECKDDDVIGCYINGKNALSRAISERIGEGGKE